MRVSGHIAREIGPGVNVKTESALEAYVRNTAVTAHHPCGTCRMGSDVGDGAVVNSELRVHGVDALRVVDASVFLDLVGGNINAPVIMIAEKVADLILRQRSVHPKPGQAVRQFGSSPLS